MLVRVKRTILWAKFTQTSVLKFLISNHETFGFPFFILIFKIARRER